MMETTAGFWRRAMSLNWVAPMETGEFCAVWGNSAVAPGAKAASSARTSGTRLASRTIRSSDAIGLLRHKRESRSRLMTTDDQRDVISFLSTPEAYGRSASPIERIDTHISIVWLAGDRA